MEMSWSQNEAPSKVWWALETSGLSSTSLTADVEELRSPASPTRSLGDSLHLEQSSIFYNYVDESDYRESEEELSAWLREERTRGVIRYQLRLQGVELVAIGCLQRFWEPGGQFCYQV
jgi:hypothetical protein